VPPADLRAKPAAGATRPAVCAGVRQDLQTRPRRLEREGGATGRIVVRTPHDLEALGSLLRNEQPIYYSADLGAVRTGAEPPGEEELGSGAS